MSGCDYCEAKEPERTIWLCMQCSATVCLDHMRRGPDAAWLCAPPVDGPYAGRGCYKPPVADDVAPRPDGT